LGQPLPPGFAPPQRLAGNQGEPVPPFAVLAFLLFS